ncbi:MAG: sulfoacetaldehyde acetyltransferase, partial [Desulfobacterales bacterium]|nr:sulfoacetaldehyde acetyltransferase [Desulfobacterales bacterium]
FRVDHPDQVGDVMKEAIASGKPCVINAIVQGGEEVLAEPFRRDALNMPVRYLAKYKHLNAK